MDSESIDEFMAGQLAAWDVPGCAVAAVRGGEAELAAGWGHRDRETGLPVTPETLFSIASVTKAFTASLAGALADDGLLEWDRPVRDYAPDIRLHDRVATERLTITDLLAHRSGLPRHDLAWIGHPDRSRADLVRRLRFLPPSRDLRQAFQYCNFGYLAAGHIVDVLTGASWEELTRDRLLGPLGMDRSNLSVDDLLADADHATGYTRHQGAVGPVPPRPRPAMAPGGGINSCAADMTRWLLAQLGEGKEIVSPATRKRQHAPHMVLDAGGAGVYSRFAYGLGWAIGRYRDHRAVMHSGSIDGFKAHCVLLPDDGAGVAVLTNGASRLMPLTVACRMLDELLGAEPLDLFSALKPRADAARAGARQARAARRVVAGAPPPRSLAEYTGTYEHPGYGALTVTRDGDILRPAFGTMRLSLAHRHYETFDLRWHERDDPLPLYPLTFLSDPDGDITALTVRFEPSVEPLRFTRRPEPPEPGVLEKLCGTYAMGPVTVTIGLRGGRTLTMAVGGAPPLELVPARGLRFRVKERPARTAEFERDGAGTVTRLVVQPAGIFYPEPAKEELPDPDRPLGPADGSGRLSASGHSAAEVVPVSRARGGVDPGRPPVGRQRRRVLRRPADRRRADPVHHLSAARRRLRVRRGRLLAVRGGVAGPVRDGVRPGRLPVRLAGHPGRRLRRGPRHGRRAVLHPDPRPGRPRRQPRRGRRRPGRHPPDRAGRRLRGGPAVVGPARPGRRDRSPGAPRDLGLGRARAPLDRDPGTVPGGDERRGRLRPRPARGRDDGAHHGDRRRQPDRLLRLLRRRRRPRAAPGRFRLPGRRGDLRQRSVAGRPGPPAGPVPAGVTFWADGRYLWAAGPSVTAEPRSGPRRWRPWRRSVRP